MRGEKLPASILFACTMNAVRSPMAAALMHHLAGGGVRVDSAGVEAGSLDPLAVEVMTEIGIPMASHQPRCFDDVKPGAYDLVVTLSPEARDRAMAAGTQVEYWPVSDPTLSEGSREQRLTAYRAVRDELLKKLKTRFHMQPA